MFSIGHLALGYLCGKTISKILNVNASLPVLFLASVLSDRIDFLVPSLEHRGPTHSLIVLSLFFLPALLLCGKRALSYFIALAQHTLIGDCMTGGAQILWPLTTRWYGLGITMMVPINILLEWGLFLTSLATMLKTGDARVLLQPHPSNLIFSVPVPIELFIPHLIYLTLFTISILKDLKTTKVSK